MKDKFKMITQEWLKKAHSDFDFAKASFAEFEQSCRILNRYYTPLKYPSHYPMMTKDQAKKAIESVELIKDAIINKL